MHNVTQDDLLQFIYNETSAKRTAEIKEAIDTDWALREKYNLLAITHQSLDAVKFSPREQTIERILNYSKKGLEELTPQG